MALPVVIILFYLVSFGLALFTLVAALRWPLVRGKHVLCAALAVELAGQVVSASWIVLSRTQGPGNSVFQVIQWSSYLSHTLAAVLMLLFVLVMRAELRGLVARESGHEE